MTSNQLEDELTEHQSGAVGPALVKVCVSWLGVIAAWSLQDWATFFAMVASIAAIIYTCLQGYVLLRDKIFRRAAS